METKEAVRLSVARRLVAKGELGPLRDAAQLSPAEVADVCGVSVTTIARWELGLNTPRRVAGLLLADLIEAVADVSVLNRLREPELASTRGARSAHPRRAAGSAA